MKTTACVRAITIVAGLAAVAGCEAQPMEALGLLPGTLEQSLVAHYRFDEADGTVLHDSSGHNRNGSVVGATWGAGRFGNALDFRRGDYVEVDGFPDATASWSASAWVREAQADLGYGTVTILSTEDALKGGWEINLTDVPGELHFHFGWFTGPGPYEYAAHDCYCMQPDVWQMVTIVVDSATMTLAFYINGALEYRGPIPRTILPGQNILYMGRWQLTERLFAGSIDDVAIYARALVPEEVMALYLAPAPDPTR